MSFAYENITDEAYIEHIKHSDNQEYIKVSQNKEPSAFPLPNRWSSPCVLSSKYERIAEHVKNFEVQPEDVWLASHPRCGTTWTQEMIWLLVNNLDFDRAKNEILNNRFPYIEYSGFFDTLNKTDSVNDIDYLAAPRTIKTHLPIQILPDQMWTVKPKIINVRRNVKDVAVSYFHHSVSLFNYRGGIEEIVNAFIADCHFFSPFNAFVADMCMLSEISDNVLLLRYEDMKSNLAGEVQRTAKFLHKSIDDNQLVQLCEHLSFKSMKANKSLNLEHVIKPKFANLPNDDNLNFIRKGQVDGWKEELTEELVDKIDKWSEENFEKYPILRKYYN